MDKLSETSKAVWSLIGIAIVVVIFAYIHTNKDSKEEKVSNEKMERVYIPFQEFYTLAHKDKMKNMESQYKQQTNATKEIVAFQEEQARIEAERLAKIKEEKRIAKKKEEERLMKLAKQQEEKKLARQKEKEKNKQLASRGTSYQGSWQTTQATHYSLGNTGGDVPACGVINLQQTGTHYQGMRIVAANTKLYPCGSVLEIKSKLGTEKAIVMDTGGFLKSKPRNIDILVRTEKEAYALGRYNIEFRVLRKGW